MKLEDLIAILNSFSVESIITVYISFVDSEGNDRSIDIKIDE